MHKARLLLLLLLLQAMSCVGHVPTVCVALLAFLQRLCFT